MLYPSKKNFPHLTDLQRHELYKVYLKEYRKSPEGRAKIKNNLINKAISIKNYKKSYNKQYSEKNKTVLKQKQKAWADKNKDHIREVNLNRRMMSEDKKLKRQETNFKAGLKRSYKITLEDYKNMHEKQGGYCAICGTHESNLKRRLQVDHCHNTGKIRELLCNSCNGGLGLMRDNPEILIKASQYLKKHGKHEN